MSKVEYRTSVGQADNKIDGKIVEIVKKTEENYRKNFDAQAKLLKEITNKAMNLNDKDKSIKDLIKEKDSFNDPFTFILDFLGRGDEGRRKITKTILGNEWDKDNVLFLGIQNLTRSKRSHLTKDTDNKDIQDNLKKIFCEDKKTCLKDSLNNNSFEEFQKIFKKPTATATSVLYWLYPEQYIPFDKPTKRLLKKLLPKIENEDSWISYNTVISALKDNKIFGDDDKFKPSMIIALSDVAFNQSNSVENILDKFLNNENKPKNIILTGIPGTGKTHAVKEYVDKNEIEHEFVQFHPSYDYEDFIEGLKPFPSENGQISFKLVDGPFKKLCKKAFADQDNTYVMIIDEINRANLSRVFGELLYCLEYRGEFVSTKMTTYINSLEDKKEYSINENNEEHIGKFTIPKNVIVLGTMNEVDRSIDAFDLALRRRFIWEDIGFDDGKLKGYDKFIENDAFKKHIITLSIKATKLNKKISDDIGANYQLGHTYYFKIIDYFDGDFNSALCDLWEYHIKSIVREYCKIKYGEHEIEAKLKEYKKIIISDNSCDG